ncbi:MAG: hypothetical protein JWM95_3481 [Gemmatimonadetes bacterium]|nr:hypothetical protein [Gemmatimonadota bacterium]
MWTRWITVPVVVLLLAPTAFAQRGPATNASVSGRVDTPRDTVQAPVPGVMVTLHRVGQDSSGAVDSVRTDANGKYSIRYTRPPNDEAVYFAAAVYRGIAYFSAPLRNPNVSGQDGAIAVFDTTRRPTVFHVAGHHLVIAAPRPDGMRDVVEVWELSNDTTLTVLGRDSLSPVWTAPLPKGAEKFSGGQGDVAADAVIARGDRVALIAPFGPGVKQISYTYSLPASKFPLSVGLEQPTSVLEVLVEEPAATVSGALLRATAAATTQGRTFKRFLGQDVPKDERVRIAVPVTTAATREIVLMVLAGVMALLMAAALWRALSRRDRVAPVRALPPSETQLLVSEIAELDARWERADATLSADEHRARREALKARLNVLLAQEQAPA